MLWEIKSVIPNSSVLCCVVGRDLRIIWDLGIIRILWDLGIIYEISVLSEI